MAKRLVSRVYAHISSVEKTKPQSNMELRFRMRFMRSLDLTSHSPELITFEEALQLIGT